jgi:biotin operon repressor
LKILPLLKSHNPNTNVMKALEQLERLQRIHDLIKAERTGCPDEFANSMHISRRQLYEYIQVIKDLGVGVKYSKGRNTFYLCNGHELDIACSIKLVSKYEATKINGGFFQNYRQRAFFLHGTKVAW